MIWNKRFIYPRSSRSIVMGRRHYEIDNEKLPSVTTILSQTQSEEKRKSLDNWKARVGAQTAERIKNISAMRGTSMDTYLEGYLTDQ